MLLRQFDILHILIRANLYPIQRLPNLQQQRQQRCTLQEFFSKYIEGTIFVFKTRKATRGVVIFFSAGVVTRDRRIGSCIQSYDFTNLQQQRQRCNLAT
jgi:hypothetical protein